MLVRKFIVRSIDGIMAVRGEGRGIRNRRLCKNKCRGDGKMIQGEGWTRDGKAVE